MVVLQQRILCSLLAYVSMIRLSTCSPWIIMIMSGWFGLRLPDVRGLLRTLPSQPPMLYRVFLFSATHYREVAKSD